MNEERSGTLEPRAASAGKETKAQSATRADDSARVDGDTEADKNSGGAGSWIWALIGLILLAIGGGVFAWLTFAGENAQQQSGPLPPLVRVATVERADSLEVRQTGFVRPLFEVDVATEVAGRIATLGPDFRRGARLAKGDVLLRLEPETFKADLEQANARLEQARAAVAEAQITRNRAEALEDRGFGTEESLQEATLGVAQAEANLATARAEITRAQSNLNDATVTAPFDALVTERTAAPGQIVQPGSRVGTIIALEAAEVEMGLVPPDLALLGDLNALIGAPVEIRGLGPDAQKLADGVVSQIDPLIDARTRTTSLVVRIEDPFSRDTARPLRMNELVELVLPARLSEETVLDIPATALTDRDTVWRVEEGILRRTQVDVLQRTQTRVLIVSAELEAGAQVMISDLAAAFDGQTVRVAQAEADAGS